MDPAKEDKKLFSLALAALGVVYGDIGTSPLYALRESLSGLPITAVNVYGILSPERLESIGQFRKQLKILLDINPDADSKEIPLLPGQPVKLTNVQVEKINSIRAAKVKQAKNVLKYVTNLQTKNARLPYDICKLTGSAFFLAWSDVEARPMLEEMIHPYFKIDALALATSDMIKALTEKLSAKERNPLELIRSEISGLFSRTILGFEISIEMAIELVKLKHINYSLFPQSFLKIHPGFYQQRKQFDTVIKKFLREQIENLRNADQKSFEQGKNLFQDTIRKKLVDGQSFKQISDGDVDKLIHDPEVRLCITGFLALDNIAEAFISGLYLLYANSDVFTNIASELRKQLKDAKEITRDNLYVGTGASDQSVKMPYLHAFFLETLRLYPPMQDMVRWTSSGFKYANVVVPPRSFVSFSLFGMMRNLFDSERYPSTYFCPERFLNPDGTLNELAKLHQDLLVPFGLGGRRCPVAGLSEVLFKELILGFAAKIPQADLRINIAEGVVDYGTPALVRTI